MFFGYIWQYHKFHTKGLFPKKLLRNWCLRRGGNKDFGDDTMQLEALSGSDTIGGGAGMVTAVRQLLQAHQREPLSRPVCSALGKCGF